MTYMPNTILVTTRVLVDQNAFRNWAERYAGEAKYLRSVLPQFAAEPFPEYNIGQEEYI